MIKQFSNYATHSNISDIDVFTAYLQTVHHDYDKLVAWATSTGELGDERVQQRLQELNPSHSRASSRSINLDCDNVAAGSSGVSTSPSPCNNNYGENCLVLTQPIVFSHR